jgi:molecular chaperone GrpE
MTDEKDKPADEIEFIPDAPGEGVGPPAAPADAGKKEPEAKAAAPEGSRPLKEKLRKREAEIKHLRKELDELKESYLRKLADMENLRKRLEREKSEYSSTPRAGLLELWAVTLSGLQTAPSDADGKTFREGVELILRMLQSLLAKNGVRPIVLEGRAFDPAFHHAMTVEESDRVAEPEIEQELQKGYLHHDRLLRPTLVKVLVPKKGQ